MGSGVKMLYVELKSDSEKLNIEPMFKKYFNEVTKGKSPKETLGMYDDKPDSWTLVLIDARGGERYLEACAKIVEWILGINAEQEILLVYDRDDGGEIARFIDMGVGMFLPVPWKRSTVRSLTARVARCVEASGKGSDDELIADEFSECTRRAKRCYETLKLKEVFFRDKSREAGNLATRIMNMNQLLVQYGLSEKALEFAGKIQRYSESLDSIMGEMNKFADRNEDHSSVKYAIFNINTLLDSITGVIASRIHALGMELIFDVDRSVPAKLEGDPVLIERILIRIIEMLLRLDGDGEMMLKVSMRDSDMEGAFDKEMVFEFINTDTLGKDEELREICRAIRRHSSGYVVDTIDAMNGKLICDGRNRETPIVVSIPTRQVERRSYRLPSKDLMDKRVLIVEPSADVAKVLSDMLEYFHMDSILADSSEGAITALRGERFDILVIDETIFDDCATRCKELKKDARIVLMEKYDRIDGRSTYRSMADTYLSKPFTQQKIFEAILDLYSTESMKGSQEEVEILKDYLHFLASYKRILLITEDESDAEVIETLLRDTGMSLVTTDRVDDVRINLSTVDFVIVEIGDRSMEEVMKIVEFCEECREKSVHAIGLASVDQEDVGNIMEATGIEDFVFKPIVPEKFYRILLDSLSDDEE
jgi:CheY-like chemotaxis protein